MILAIETSCDETSVAVVSNGKILSNVLYSQIRHHKKHGGVVPELASRLHAEYIDSILSRALNEAGVSLNDITAVAVTVGPGLEGALLVGMTAAYTLSQFLAVPLIPVNHLHGHVFSAKEEFELEYPLLVCLASGGHTMIIHMQSESEFDLICNTMDDACGEAFDKVARMLDLGYPGGPKIEALAKNGQPTINYPHPVKKNPNMFSFSGLKTAVLNSTKIPENPPENIACSFQLKVAEILLNKLQISLQERTVKQLILCGGVFANQMIRGHISENVSVDQICVPSLKLCTDNAGMIGLAAEVYQNLDSFSSLRFECCPQLGLKYPQ